MTFPPLYESARRLSISDLKGYGLFKDGAPATIITFYRNGQTDLQVGVRMIFLDGEPLEFQIRFEHGDGLVKMEFRMVWQNSNIGKGKLWYFLCPHSGKRCRILFGFGRYFGHRTIYKDAMYDIQVYSRHFRQMVRGMKPCEYWPSSRPKYYAGKITRPYAAYLNRQQKRFASSVYMRDNMLSIL
jgi:hypothetical protein